MIKRAIALIAIAIVSAGLAGNRASASEADEAAAMEAAQVWLKLAVDGNYGDCWDISVGPFKAAIGRDRWSHSLDVYRKPRAPAKSALLSART